MNKKTTKKTPEPIGPPGLVMAVMAFFAWDAPMAQKELQAVAHAVERLSTQVTNKAWPGDGDSAAGDICMVIHRRYRQRLGDESRERLKALLADDLSYEDLADNIAFGSGEMGLLAGMVAGWHLRDQLLVTNGGAK